MLTAPARRTRLAVAVAIAAVGTVLPLIAASPARADIVRQKEQWVLHALDVPAAWPTTQGRGVLVAVIAEFIDEALQQQQNFFGSASHELKTPLAILRTELEVGLRKQGLEEGVRQLLSNQLEEISRLQAIVVADVVGYLHSDKCCVERESLPPNPWYRSPSQHGSDLSAAAFRP